MRKAEKEVEYLSSEMSSSLQKWLKITYQKEVKNFQYRRDVAMRKMEEAKDAVCYMFLLYFLHLLVKYIHIHISFYKIHYNIANVNSER